MTRIIVTNQTIGDVAQYTARTAHYTTTIVFAAGGPFVILWGRPIRIDDPSRFGPTNTPSQRLAFVHAYVDATISPNGSQAAV